MIQAVWAGMSMDAELLSRHSIIMVIGMILTLQVAAQMVLLAINPPELQL